MSMDDCFIPLPSPLHDRWRRGSHPCLSQLDLDERAAAGSGTAGEGAASHGVPRRILQSPNRPLAVPPRRPPPPLDPLPTYKGNSLHAFPEEEPKQHLVTVSRAASKGRYARFKENLNAKPQEIKQHHQQVAVSCASSKGRNRNGWMSHERSTPEGINMEEHALRFQPLPPPRWTGDFDLASIGIPPVIRKRKPPEVRNALRERRVAARQKDARYHAEVALRKYNRANNTKYELVDVKVISIFYEFGGGGAHYNFTAKQPEDQQNADADSTKLFFSEVDLYFRSEKDVIMCCIVGENDAGRCYGCENRQPVVHPSSEAYGGGSSTCIDYPGSDGDSDSD